MVSTNLTLNFMVGLCMVQWISHNGYTDLTLNFMSSLYIMQWISHNGSIEFRVWSPHNAMDLR